MKSSAIIVLGVLVCAAAVVLAEERLQIGVTFRPEKCERKTSVGDTILVHYTGTLEDGTKFDSSVDRGDPFRFTLGQGMVIKGWDHGLLGACIGEKRKLKIPAHMGYGERGAPPTIPPNAKLIFTTEIVDIVGK